MKSQIWSLDLIFSLVIFGFTITILAASWLAVSNQVGFSRNSNAELLVLQTRELADNLLSPGYPANWYGTFNSTNATTWAGIVPGIGSSSNPGSIAPYKLYALISMSNYNYRSTQSLFGIGYDYYVEISSGANSTQAENITFGNNPFNKNVSGIYVIQRSALLNGVPVNINIMCWTNSSTGVS